MSPLCLKIWSPVRYESSFRHQFSATCPTVSPRKRIMAHLNMFAYRWRHLSLSSMPWSIRPLTTHDVFIFKVRFLAASHMVRGDVCPVFSITWLRKRSLCPPLAFFPWTLPARMRSSSSPFRMMWPVKRVCLSLMVLRSWRSCPIR